MLKCRMSKSRSMSNCMNAKCRRILLTSSYSVASTIPKLVLQVLIVLVVQHKDNNAEKKLLLLEEFLYRHSFNYSIFYYCEDYPLISSGPPTLMWFNTSSNSRKATKEYLFLFKLSFMQLFDTNPPRCNAFFWFPFLWPTSYILQDSNIPLEASFFLFKFLLLHFLQIHDSLQAISLTKLPKD